MKIQRLPLSSRLLAGFVALGIGTSAGASVNGKIDKTFTLLDLNNDAQLSFQEYLGSQSSSRSIVLCQAGFEYADVDDNGYLSLTEFRATRGGKDVGPKLTTIQIFQKLDDDQNDLLDPIEYIDFFAKKKSYRDIIKSFDKKDKDDDGYISPREFGIKKYPA
jgi:Ca2+-binding EF-hand superfamily protein